MPLERDDRALEDVEHRAAEQPGRADALADLERKQEVLAQPVLRHGEVEVVPLLVGVEEAGADGGAARQFGERPEPVLRAGLAARRLPGGLLGTGRRGSARAHGAAGNGRRRDQGEGEGRTSHDDTPSGTGSAG